MYPENNFTKESFIMKNTFIALLCALLVSSVLLVSCDKAADKTDTGADTKTEQTTSSDTPVDTDLADVHISSDAELREVEQKNTYAVDTYDFSDFKGTTDGDITGIWLSDILKTQMEMDNNPDTTEYMSYRMAFSFHDDGTALIYIFMSQTEIEVKYTLDGNGGIEFSDAERLSIPNAHYEISEDGQYMKFTSDTLKTNMMRIDD